MNRITFQLTNAIVHNVCRVTRKITQHIKEEHALLIASRYSISTPVTNGSIHQRPHDESIEGDIVLFNSRHHPQYIFWLERITIGVRRRSGIRTDARVIHNTFRLNTTPYRVEEAGVQTQSSRLHHVRTNQSFYRSRWEAEEFVGDGYQHAKLLDGEDQITASWLATRNRTTWRTRVNPISSGRARETWPGNTTRRWERQHLGTSLHEHFVVTKQFNRLTEDGRASQLTEVPCILPAKRLLNGAISTLLVVSHLTRIEPEDTRTHHLGHFLTERHGVLIGLAHERTRERDDHRVGVVLRVQATLDIFLLQTRREINLNLRL